jgi:hypothetical protein
MKQIGERFCDRTTAFLSRWFDVYTARVDEGHYFTSRAASLGYSSTEPLMFPIGSLCDARQVVRCSVVPCLTLVDTARDNCHDMSSIMDVS